MATFTFRRINIGYLPRVRIKRVKSSLIKERLNYFSFQREDWSFIRLNKAVNIEGVDTDFEPKSNYMDWVVIKEQSYLPNKEEYIKNAFNKRFPKISLPADETVAYNFITNLASRSEVVAEALALFNAEYSISAQMPTYYKDVLDNKTFEKARSEITQYNNVVADYQNKRQQAAIKYKKELEQIDKNEQESLNKFKQNKVLQVLTLPSTSLPLSLQVAVEKYTADEKSPNKKVYLREILSNYKKYLLKELKANPDLDIQKLIKDNQEK